MGRGKGGLVVGKETSLSPVMSRRRVFEAAWWLSGIATRVLLSLKHDKDAFTSFDILKAWREL